MSILSIEEISKATSGKILSQTDLPIEVISTDTRKEVNNSLFVCFRGDNFDAHDFLMDAVSKGASALLVDREDVVGEEIKQKVSIILVEDVLKGFQALANYWRKKHKFKVIAITGSNGKTTSKEFTQEILSKKFKTYCSKGSFNNHWGVPLTLTAAMPGTEIVICEMGMNHEGEITNLCKIAEPDVVVCTTVGSSHLGELGSVAAVARAKGEIYDNSPNAISIFNINNEHTQKMYEKETQQNPKGKKLKFSSMPDDNADVSLRVAHMSLEDLNIEGEIAGVKGKVNVPVFGRQNVNNLMVAASIALSVGMTPEEIWASLPACKTAWGRNQLMQSKTGATIIFDAYNANLESVSALVRNLYEIENKGKKYVILGEMFELGEFTSSYHRQLGLLTGRCEFDFFWFIGNSMDEVMKGVKESGSKNEHKFSKEYSEVIMSEVSNQLMPGDIVVIKGSRGMRLERTLEILAPEALQKP